MQCRLRKGAVVSRIIAVRRIDVSRRHGGHRCRRRLRQQSALEPETRDKGLIEPPRQGAAEWAWEQLLERDRIEAARQAQTPHDYGSHPTHQPAPMSELEQHLGIPTLPESDC